MGKTVALEGLLLSCVFTNYFNIFEMSICCILCVKQKSNLKIFFKNSWPTWHYVYKVLDVTTSFKEFIYSISTETLKKWREYNFGSTLFQW